MEEERRQEAGYTELNYATGQIMMRDTSGVMVPLEQLGANAPAAGVAGQDTSMPMTITGSQGAVDVPPTVAMYADGILKQYSNNPDMLKAKLAELSSAIDQLNNGKSPDQIPTADPDIKQVVERVSEHQQDKAKMQQELGQMLGVGVAAAAGTEPEKETQGQAASWVKGIQEAFGPALAVLANLMEGLSAQERHTAVASATVIAERSNGNVEDLGHGTAAIDRAVAQGVAMNASLPQPGVGGHAMGRA